jgi:tetratricopeptide (TPR) repeat protein
MFRKACIFIFVAMIFAVGCASKPETKVVKAPAFKPTGDPKIDEPKIFELERIVRNNPDDKNAHIRLGNAYIKMERYERGAEQLEKANTIEPDPRLNLYLASMYVKLKKYDKAMERYRQYKHRFPSDPSGNALIGNMYMKLNQPDKALIEYNIAIRKSSKPGEYFTAYSGKGYSLHAMGNREESLKAFKKALSRKPGDSKTIQVINMLEDAERQEKQ